MFSEFMSTLFSLAATRYDLFHHVDTEHPFTQRLSIRVSGGIFQIMFDGRRIPEQATDRAVLTVYPSSHPTAKRLLPEAETEYVVVYDTPERDDVAEEVRSCERLGLIAMTYSVMPGTEALAASRFAAKHL